MIGFESVLYLCALFVYVVGLCAWVVSVQCAYNHLRMCFYILSVYATCA